MLLDYSFMSRIVHPLYASSYAQTYYGIVLYLFLAALLTAILASIAYLFSLSAAQDSEKRSEYECGFEPFDSATRLPFDVHFYLVGILFLIFDVEIALLFPWALSLRTSGWFGFYIMIAFIAVLAVGFLYEWKRGALIWPSRQSERDYVGGLTKYNMGFLSVLMAASSGLYGTLDSAVLVITLAAALIVTRRRQSISIKGISRHPYRALPSSKIQARLLASVAKTKRRLVSFARRVSRRPLKTLKSYQRIVRYAEKYLRRQHRTLQFYLKLVTKLAARERTKNFYNEPKIAQMETNNLHVIAHVREEYMLAVKAYQTVFAKLQRAQTGIRSGKKPSFVVRRAVASLIRFNEKTIKKHVTPIVKPKYKRGSKRPSFKRKFRATRKTKKTGVKARLKSLTPMFAAIAEELYFWQFTGFLLPEVLLSVLVTVVLCIVSSDLDQHREQRVVAEESMKALRLGLTFASILYCVQIVAGETTSLFNGYVLVTTYTLSMKLLTLLACRFILSNSKRFMRGHFRSLLEYPLILVISTLFMVILVGSGHLLASFLALVGFSLNLYVLVLFDATWAPTREAGIKYFYLSAISSGLVLYGVFLFFSTIGTSHVYEMGQFLATSLEIIVSAEILMLVALSTFLVGVFFKLSAFPGHLWAAEVYEGSPDPITGFFMLPVKVAVIAFVTQLLAVSFEPLTALWQPIVVLSAGASLIWGCFAALTEPKTKRFFAYASINQIGFLLTGLASGSADGYRTTLFYLLLYAVMNVALLVVFLNTRQLNEDSLTYLVDFQGFGRMYAGYSWSLAMSLLSMAGIPPLVGFFGKYYLLLHAQEQELYSLVVIGLLTSLVSTYYYLRLIKIFWFESPAGLTPIICSLSPHRALTLLVSEWSLFLFALGAGTLIDGMDVVICDLLHLNQFVSADCLDAISAVCWKNTQARLVNHVHVLTESADKLYKKIVVDRVSFLAKK